MQSRIGRNLAFCWRPLLSPTGIRRRSIIEVEILVTVRIRLVLQCVRRSLRVPLLAMRAISHSPHAKKARPSFQVLWSKDLRVFIEDSSLSSKRIGGSSSEPIEHSRFDNRMFDYFDSVVIK